MVLVYVFHEARSESQPEWPCLFFNLVQICLIPHFLTIFDAASIRGLFLTAYSASLRSSSPSTSKISSRSSPRSSSRIFAYPVASSSARALAKICSRAGLPAKSRLRLRGGMALAAASHGG
jgi:hypothetical protein